MIRERASQLTSGADRRLGSHPVRWQARSFGATCLAAALVVTALGACDDWDGRRGPDGWGGPRDGRRWTGRGRDDHFGGWRDRGRDGADAGALTDAGSAALDAGGDAALDGGAADGGASDGVLDAGAASEDAGILAASDGEILSVLDAASVAEIERARAALPSLADADVTAFAQAMLSEHEAVRETLTALGAALELAPAPSPLADELRSAGDATAAVLAASDAGASDAAYIEAEVLAQARVVSVLAALLASVDAEPLRAELLVRQVIVEDHLARARALAAALAG